MDAWDKLDLVLSGRFEEADSESALSGITQSGDQIVITFSDLRQILSEGHPDR